jgi:predicted porin
LTGIPCCPVAAASDATNDSLPSLHGLTLYGTVDIGLQYQTHAAPTSAYFPGGSADFVQKNDREAVFGVTPNNWGQSKIGLQGIEPLQGSWSAVFTLETFFNPQSGQISDGLKSLALNNGRPLAAQTTNLDSSVAGQLFQQSFAGLRATQFGTLTFGRQTTVLAEGIINYDPNHASQAFSLIGASGAAAGGGNTEDRRLDSSLKYVSPESYLLHSRLQLKLSDSSGAAGSAAEINIGAVSQDGSVDLYYARVNRAISASSLSATQLSLLPSLGLSPANSLAAVASDNEAYALMGLYRWDRTTWSAGYERIRYANPSGGLATGFEDIGGYALAFINTAAFPEDKILQVYWMGARYRFGHQLEGALAYYGFSQNSYGTGIRSGCRSDVAATCGGTLNAASLQVDYQWTARFDVYAGVLYTAVHDGLASGYSYPTYMNPTIGLRYAF